MWGFGVFGKFKKKHSRQDHIEEEMEGIKEDKKLNILI
jgi:hypothetical protein